jgi:hypothetical protein
MLMIVMATKLELPEARPFFLRRSLSSRDRTQTAVRRAALINAIVDRRLQRKGAGAGCTARQAFARIGRSRNAGKCPRSGASSR